MAAICRFGMRMVPNISDIIAQCRNKKELVQGPHIAEFEQEFLRVLGGRGHVRAVSTEYGRMALYFILKALDIPAGSEIIVPALTFWVVPEITRVAGLKPVFADIDPHTFTLDPKAAERAITPNTRAILPTHLYGMSCDMAPIMALARKHNLKVIEDCAHALGTTCNGQPAGTFGDGSFFSFQGFKPLNTYGGGLAWVRDADVAKKVWEFADAEQWPSEKRVESILRTGWWQHTFIRPRVFTLSLFPVWYVPAHYRGKFSNVQAAIGLAGLQRLPEFIERTRRHAKVYDEMLGDVPGVTIPRIPEGRNHVYYQYCPYVPDYLDLVKRCIRRGVDVAPMHVDHCTTMEIFDWKGPASPGAARAMTAVQMPVYESLSDAEIERIGRLVREQAQRR